MVKANKPNRKNLQLMADHIKTISQEVFDMRDYRFLKKHNDGYLDVLVQKLNSELECGSVGCVIGHCVVLDENVRGIPRFTTNRINYEAWSERFTGLIAKTLEWQWCFGSDWVNCDNTPIGASKRIEYFLNHGLPEDWNEQFTGRATQSYS